MFYLLIIIIGIIILIIFCHGKGIPIFLYHQVNNECSNISVEQFEKHLKVLKKQKFKLITMSELLKLKRKDSKKRKIALITLDDGYYDNYKYVFPLLKKHNMKATIFLNTFYIKDRREEEAQIQNSNLANYNAIKRYLEYGDAESEQYMTWSEIKEMHASGLVDFQAHSHKHMAAFKNLKLEGVFERENNKDATNLYCYKKNVKIGYPILKKRGEYSIKAVTIEEDFFEEFKKFYDNNLKNKNKKEILRQGQKFIDENLIKLVKVESDKDAASRIKNELSINKSIIENKLKKNVEFFCWPWGHKSIFAIKILEKEGIVGFVTTVKGTNSFDINLKKIRRIELRKFTTKKFKINLFVGRNLFLGRIYELFS